MQAYDPAVWAKLQQVILGYQASQAVYVAAKLGIADLLYDSDRTVSDLAETCGAHPTALYRTLRLLASEGIFAETDVGHFTLTPMAALLRTGVPGSLRARAIFSGEERYRAWGELIYSVKTGRPAFEHVFGMPFYEYLARHPETEKTFSATMSGETTQQLQPVVAAYDFSGFKTVVDIGGGHGALLGTILQAHPHLHGVLFDRPSVIQGAHALLAAAGVADRCKLVAGNMFEAVPSGGDAYILKYLIYDWDDERAVAILKNCRHVIPDDGKLLLVEILIPRGNEPFYGKALDLNMLVLLTGRARTETEYRALMDAAGFALKHVIPTQSVMTLFVAVPV